MIRLWLFAPALAISALGASTYWWHMEKDTWQPPRAKLPDLPQVTALPMRAVPLTKQSLERPLLWTSRRPVLTGEKKQVLHKNLSNPGSWLCWSRALSAWHCSSVQMAVC